MLLIPAEHSTPGSREECLGVIALTMSCQLHGFNVECRCGNYPPLGCREKERLILPGYCQSAMPGWTFLHLLARCWLLDELGVHNYKFSEYNAGMVISAPTNSSLVPRRTTRCSHLQSVKVRHKYWAGCITTPSWLFKLEEHLLQFTWWNPWHGDLGSSSS